MKYVNQTNNINELRRGIALVVYAYLEKLLMLTLAPQGRPFGRFWICKPIRFTHWIQKKIC